MSEAAVTTSKGRGGRGKKNKEDIEEIEKAQESETVSHKKGITKRKNVGKKDEESGIEENGQTETTATVAPPKKAGRFAKGKAAKTVDDDAEEIGDGDNVLQVETLPPKRGSRARKEVVYKEVDEDIDNKKRRGAAKLETKAAGPKKNDKTKSKAAAPKTKKKAVSEEEDDEEEDEEPQKDSEDELDAIEEKEETVAPEKLAADEDDEDEVAEEEEAPPTKKARGGRSKPATKKDSEKPPVVAEKSSRKRGGKKAEEVSAVKKDEVAVPKTKTRGPRKERTNSAVANGAEQHEDNGGNSTVSTKGRKPRVSKSKPKTLELENVTVRRGKPISKRKLKPTVKEGGIENEASENVIVRRDEIIPKRKKDENGKDGGSTESKRMKLYELVPIEKDYNLKISTWNVAGIRAWLSKGGLEFINRENPDIICLQETKCVEEDMPAAAKIVGYHPYYLCKTGGYAGIAIYSKIMPMKIEYGIRDPEFDEQGRIMTAEFEKFFLICVYVPNSSRQLVNLEKRMKWNKLFLEFVKSLDQTLSKSVIICGDMNVAHLEIDLANPKSNKRSPGFTQEERDDMTELLAHGFVDTFRYLYPNKKDCYTYWTYMSNARARNVGWRLDYFIVSERMISRIVDNVIRSEVYGSDHCPVTLFLNMNKQLVSK